MSSIAPGIKAPDFTLLDADGGPVSLSSRRGRWVVLYFYPRDNTSGCTIEAIDFTLNLPDFKKLKADVLGVSPDSCESHSRFTLRHNLGTTLLSDPDRNVIEMYGAWGAKKSFGREAMGVIRTTVLIDPRGVIAQVWPKVSVRGHADQVLNRLRELAGKKGTIR
jgi:peroxiredoxin Q/BCP